jgi:hypothetical protein
MVEWINYLEATTSSTMISLTPQNAQLRRRFPFFFYLFLFRLLLQYWCCGCYIISKEEEDEEKYRIKVDRVCVVFHSMLIGPVSQYNDAQRGNLYFKRTASPSQQTIRL